MSSIVNSLDTPRSDFSVGNRKFTTVGGLNGRSIVQIDPSFAKKRNFVAGVGPEMFKGMGTTILMCGSSIVLLFSTTVSTLAVGAATDFALKPTLVTLGVGLGVSAAVPLAIKLYERLSTPQNL